VLSVISERKFWLVHVVSALVFAGASSAAGAAPGATMAPVAACETQTRKQCQESQTPQSVLTRLQAGNHRFVKGTAVKRSLRKQALATAPGQYPLASVVSCFDSRIPPEIVFDQGIGDIFIARNAGNVISDDVLGSLEFGSKASGAKLIVVLGHTQCGAIKGACDNVQLGNLTGLLAKIKPAISKIPDDGKDRSSKNHDFVDMVGEQNVRLGVQTIRDKSPILKEMEDKGEIMIVGAMYDLKTGKVSFYDLPAAPAGKSKKI
jgi:carbonic anhydrase